MLVGCYDSTELTSVGAVKIVSTWYGLTLPSCVPACQGLYYRYAVLVSIWYRLTLPSCVPACQGLSYRYAVLISIWYGLTLPSCMPACHGLYYRYAVLVSTWYGDSTLVGTCLSGSILQIYCTGNLSLPLALRVPVETLVSLAICPVPPDIVHAFLPTTPGHFQHDHGKA